MQMNFSLKSAEYVKEYLNSKIILFFIQTVDIVKNLLFLFETQYRIKTRM